MSTDQTRGDADDKSLERIREASDAVEKTTAEIVIEKVVARWQTAGAIVVLAITAYLLYVIDGELSTDVYIFSILTVLLLAYFLVTLRTDVRME